MAPGAITGLTVEQTGGTELTISWDDIGAPEYRVRWGPVGSGWAGKYPDEAIASGPGIVMIGMPSEGEIQVVARDPLDAEQYGPISAPVPFSLDPSYGGPAGPSVELTARDQGYYYLFVNGAQFSRHVQEREAAQVGISAKLAAPRASVTYMHGVNGAPYAVDITLDGEPVAVTQPAAPPVSDNGEDLIDFIDRIDGEPTSFDFIDAPDIGTALAIFAEQTKETWLVKRLFMSHVDGSREFVGIGWRGYILFWQWRDKGALRVGS